MWPERDFSVQLYLLARRIGGLMATMAKVTVTGGIRDSAGTVDDDGRGARGTWVGSEGCLEVYAEEDRRG